MTVECKNVISSMLEKDKDKRLELIKFADMDYYLWDDETLEEKIDSSKKMHTEKSAKLEEEKETRLQEEFLHKLEIKDEHKPAKKHVNFMSPPSPSNKKKKTISRKPTS